MQKHLLMSIKTKNTNEIFNGIKKYEFRRKSIGEKNLNKKIFIYSSEESKEIVGYIIVDKIISGGVDKLLKETKYEDKKSIKEYFEGCKECYALHINQIYKFERPIKLSEIKEKYNDFVIPQFYRYLKEEESIYKKIIGREVIHQINVNSKYYKYIKNYNKKIDLKLNDVQIKNIKIHDIIVYNVNNQKEKLLAQVVKLYKSNNFEELLKNLDIELLINSSKTKDKILKELNKLYSQEEQNKHGVVGIEIKPQYLILDNIKYEIKGE